jgi:hypothetical protein
MRLVGASFAGGELCRPGSRQCLLKWKIELATREDVASAYIAIKPNDRTVIHWTKVSIDIFVRSSVGCGVNNARVHKCVPRVRKNDRADRGRERESARFTLIEAGGFAA